MGRSFRQSSGGTGAPSDDTPGEGVAGMAEGSWMSAIAGQDTRMVGRLRAALSFGGVGAWE